MGHLQINRAAVRALLDLAAPTGESGPDVATVVGLLRSLATLVRADVAFWHWLSPSPTIRTYAYVQDPSMVAFIPELEPQLAHVLEQPSVRDRRGPVVKMDDLLSGRRLRIAAAGEGIFRIDGLRHEIGVQMPRIAGERNMIVLSRGERNFSDRDHDLLELVRPHLAGALHQWRRPPPDLTARQAQVMDLVVDGLSDAQIAKRLGLSESTIGKHLEHIYARTGSHSRVQAALLWDRWA